MDAHFPNPCADRVTVETICGGPLRAVRFRGSQRAPLQVTLRDIHPARTFSDERNR